MSTLWKWRIHLFVRAADNTAENRTAFAEIFSNNGSLESVANERLLFDTATRLSTSGELPTQVFGISSLVKADMRTAMQDFLDTLSQSRWYAIAAMKLPNYAAGDLVADNGGSGTVGEPFTWQDALDDLYTERGLQVID